MIPAKFREKSRLPAVYRLQGFGVCPLRSLPSPPTLPFIAILQAYNNFQIQILDRKCIVIKTTHA